ncbi:CAP family protein [Sandaracinus amylolyticus]|nr:CAP family protein [Sandaracinus amylolyticus]
MRRFLALALLLTACAQHTATTRSTSPSIAPGGDTSASDAPSDPRLRAVLDAHNTRRAEHCAPPLSWSDELARTAQSWADDLARRGCAFEHNRTPYGENLAAGTSGTLSPQAVVDMWHRERERYRFRNGRFSMQTGHFTQVVWRGTARVGCGTSTCNGMDVWVCNYDPPGNVQGQFDENVLPTSCRR